MRMMGSRLSTETPAHCKATPEFVPRSMATIVDITGTEIYSSLTCPSHFLESSKNRFILSENIFQLNNSTRFVVKVVPTQAPKINTPYEKDLKVFQS